MDEKNLRDIALTLTKVIPALGKKLFKPLDQQKATFTPIQVNTLDLLTQRTSCTMTELAHEMDVSNQQMTAVINQIASRRLVSRKHDQDDRRIVNISITATGKQQLKEHTDRMVTLISGQLKDLDEADNEKLYLALINLKSVLDKINM